MRYFLPLLLTAVLSFGVASSVNAQCKNFTKKECIPTLKPYTYNGQYNNAVLAEGDVAELLLTFHKDQKYRVSVCSEEIIGNVNFKIFDTKHQLIFDQSQNSDQSFWDFVSNATQQLIIQVTVPVEIPKNEVVKTGCVTILVGFLDE
ncbi:MAG: hypothetical protein JXR60_08475 [Bacteroidales bacterium]|nr:hypothetical protein [Bacteroidales bacterium]